MSPAQSVKVKRPITSHESRLTRGNSSDEFPIGASEWPDDISRREFLRLGGASLALAGFGACTKQPIEPIVPYVRQPEELVPGRPLFYATAFELSGYATPVLVESHMYRPTKIEGNEQHVASQGGTDLYAQASILDLYDPDRSQTIAYLGDVGTWGDFLQAIHGPLAIQKTLQGAGIRISQFSKPRMDELSGDSDWTQLQFDFPVAPGGTGEVDLLCELRASKGEVWFDLNSLSLIKR